MTQPQIIRGTTPTITFTFNDMDPYDITKAVLAIKQSDVTVIEKTDGMTKTANTISWTLTQTETLSLSTSNNRALIVCDWLTTGGVRGRSVEQYVSVGEPAKNAEISA